MSRALKLLAGMGAAIVGGAIGDLLYAQRDAKHPDGVVVAALTPAQVVPCFLIVALAAHATKGNLLAMLGSGLLAGIGTSLAYGAGMKAAMVVKMRARGERLNLYQSAMVIQYFCRGEQRFAPAQFTVAPKLLVLPNVQTSLVGCSTDYCLFLARIRTHLAEIVQSITQRGADYVCVNLAAA